MAGSRARRTERPPGAAQTSSHPSACLACLDHLQALNAARPLTTIGALLQGELIPCARCPSERSSVDLNGRRPGGQYFPRRRRRKSPRWQRRERSLTRDERAKLGIRDVPLTARGRRFRGMRRPGTGTAADAGQAACGLGKVPFAAACYSYAGAREDHHWVLWSALSREARRGSHGGSIGLRKWWE